MRNESEMGGAHKGGEERGKEWCKVKGGGVGVS